jgi:hypothetical protein
MDRTTLALKTPVKFGDQTIAELQIRKPKARDMRALKVSGTFDDQLKLLGRLAGQPDPVIDELEIEDMTEALKIVAGFMPDGPETGTSVSP